MGAMLLCRTASASSALKNDFFKQFKDVLTFPAEEVELLDENLRLLTFKMETNFFSRRH